MSEFAANLTLDVSAARYALVTLAALAAGITDWLWLRISNLLTIPLIASGVLFHSLFPAGEGALFTFLGAGCGFGTLVLLFAAGGVGGGDVKLLAGIGAWIGAHDVLVVFIVTALLTGIWSLAVIAWTNTWKDMPRRFGDAFRSLLGSNARPGHTVEEVAQQDERTRRGRLVPMGTMIAFALLILLIHDFLQSPRETADSHTRGDHFSFTVHS